MKRNSQMVVVMDKEEAKAAEKESGTGRGRKLGRQREGMLIGWGAGGLVCSVVVLVGACGVRVVAPLPLPAGAVPHTAPWTPVPVGGLMGGQIRLGATAAAAR